jgi:hypothetical protein
LEAIHPKLYHKNTIFIGKIAKQLLKGTLKIDLDDDKKDDSLNLKIPDFKPEDLLNTKDYILIFDDLERCSINIINLLGGYINFFVEHQSYKVILIANEEELEKTEKYTLIKEKLIGKTFEFISDASSAYDSFLGELENEKDIKEKILQKYKDEILKIFKKSQCNNLRILRQGLFDFERLYKLVFIKHISNYKLIDEIINLFFIFIFEIKSGESCTFKKLQNDIGKTWDKARDKAFEKAFNTKIIEDKNIKKKEETIYEIISSKYDFLLEGNMILSIETWQEIIENSYIDIEKINCELNESKYYLDQNTPSWKKLTNYYNLEDIEFEKLLKDIYKRFSQNEYKNYQQFKLVASMLLYFQEKKLLEIDYETFFDLIKKNFNLLFEECSFDFKNIFFIKKSREDRSYENIRYFESESFDKLLNFIDEFLREKEILNLKNDSELIIKIIEERNKKELFDLLEGQNDIRVIDCKKKPILNQINIDKLFKVLIKTDGLTMYYFGDIIKDRYDDEIKDLLCEETFLKELLEKIDNYLKGNEYKLSSYNLKKEIKENILIALEKIEKFKKSSE